ATTSATASSAVNNASTLLGLRRNIPLPPPCAGCALARRRPKPLERATIPTKGATTSVIGSKYPARSPLPSPGGDAGHLPRRHVTGHPVSPAQVLELRLHLPADGLRQGAAGVEAAAFGRVGGTGHVAG